jgi:uncharacterized protein involved in copper resistance
MPMRSRLTVWVALTAAAWIVSACTIPVQMDHSNMPGMDHGEMSQMHQEHMSGMEHGEMMNMDDPEFFDAQFIDGMIEHPTFRTLKIVFSELRIMSKPTGFSRHKTEGLTCVRLTFDRIA